MGNTISLSRVFLGLAWSLPMFAVVACSQADRAGIEFDIPSQPAAPGLNEFAHQADITLIFSYDLVANDRTQALQGRYTVEGGLKVLLGETQLAYRKAQDGTYLICPRDHCALAPAAHE